MHFGSVTAEIVNVIVLLVMMIAQTLWCGLARTNIPKKATCLSRPDWRGIKLDENNNLMK